jgi:cob(I)alamin adenosyltransferase
LKVYTRRGDSGETDLFGGERVPKDHRRVEAYGAVDELNAVVGVAAAQSPHEDLRELARRVQSALFDLGAHLATPDAARRAKAGVADPEDETVSELERSIDALEEELEPLKRFVLPAGTPAAAAFHVARAVCRRAERRVVELHRGDPLVPAALRYVNRLSDLLFVLARVENRRAGVAEVEWRGRRGSEIGATGD